MADQGTLDFRLANITFQDLPRSRDYPDLYYHVSTPPAPAGSSGCDGVTFDPGTTRLLDFATYLNALSYEKWRRYTTVDNVWLHLRLCGACTVSLTRIDATAAAPTRTVVATREVTATQNGDGWTTLDLPYDDVDGATLLAFEVLTHGPVSFGEAYYYSKVDPVQVRHVELALATTTFRNERYVLPNIELVRREILGSDEPIARGFTMHVVDNGRTLTPEQVEGPRILLHPNPNAGGSGGFTRGMIEAMEQEPRATHVLLMDDDVQVSPEAIKRTYNILSLLRPEWDDAFVSGAYLSLERQDEFTENVGYVNARGAFGPLLQGQAVSARRWATAALPTTGALRRESDGLSSSCPVLDFNPWNTCELVVIVCDDREMSCHGLGGNLHVIRSYRSPFFLKVRPYQAIGLRIFHRKIQDMVEIHAESQQRLTILLPVFAF